MLRTSFTRESVTSTASTPKGYQLIACQITFEIIQYEKTWYLYIRPNTIGACNPLSVAVASGFASAERYRKRWLFLRLLAANYWQKLRQRHFATKQDTLLHIEVVLIGKGKFPAIL